MSAKKFACRGIGAVLVVAIAMGSVTGIASAEVPSAMTASAVGIAGSEDLESVASSVGEDLTALENVLRVLDSIPEDVLKRGDQASMEWLQSHYSAAPVDGVSPYAFNWVKCSTGIFVAIGSNTLAVLKVLKIKRAIDKMGGVGKIIAKIQGKKKKGKKFKQALFESFEEAGTGMGALAAEILGIDGVINNCW